MACPQCGDPVNCIGIQSGSIVHRCPVCGTQVTGSGLTNNLCVEVPELVGKLRDFARSMEKLEGPGNPILAFLWRAWGELGIDRIVDGGKS